MSRFAGAFALSFVLLFCGSAHAQLQVCCAKPQLLPDIRATGLEVTQGVQASTLPADGAKYAGVPLVAHRTTVVRLYADVDGNGSAGLVSASLSGTRGGRPLPGSPLSADEVFKRLDPGGAKVTAAQRGDSGQGFTFTLPDSWTTGTVRLRGRVSAVGVVYGTGGECATAACAADNAYSVSAVRFVSTGSERVETIRLGSGGPGPGTALATPKLLQPLADGAFQFDPARYAAEMDIARLAGAGTVGGLVGHCAALLGAAACGVSLDARGQAALVLSQLADATLVDQTCKAIGTPFPCPDQVAGIGAVPAQASRGTLGGPALSTAVIDGGSAQGAAHELGHGLGRDDAGCGGLDGMGLDIRPGSGVASGGEYRAFGGSGVFDYMGACDGTSSWLSPKGWGDEVKALQAYAKAHARAAAVTPVAGLHVTGFAVGSGPLVLWNVRPAVAVGPADDKAGYTAVVRSRAGRALGRAVLRAEQTHVDDLAGGKAAAVTIVDGIVPLKGATALTLPAGAADLVVTRAGRPVATRARSAHRPTVKLTAPRAARVKGRSVKVAWKAADVDKDTLSAAVDYSADGGRSFRTVWSGPSTGSATVPAAVLAASGNGFLRVRVSDGFDVATALSHVLTVPGRAPDVAIAYPARGATVGASSPLRLAGEAYDDHFAPLGDAALSWTLDGKPVAAGARATLASAKPGRHMLRLVATDASGRRGRATVKLTVAPVTPQPLTLVAPAKLASTTKSFTLRVAATTASKLAVSGAGVTSQTVAVDRDPLPVTVTVKPGSSAVRLSLTFRAGKYGTRSTLVVAR